MPYNIPAVNVVATKMASGAVQLVFTHAAGDLHFACVIPAADFTSFNTTVNGGATGATVAKSYAQDASQGDYPQGYAPGA